MPAETVERLRTCVLQALRERRIADAETLLQGARDEAVGDPDYWRLGFHVAVGRGPSAVEAWLDSLLADGPADARLLLEAGLLCHQLGRRRAAGSAAEAASRAVEPADAVTMDAIGALCVNCGLIDFAVGLFRRAVALSGEQPSLLYNLAAGERMLGHVADAEAALARVLSADPDHAEAHHMLAGLKTQTVEANHVATIEAALGRTGRAPERKVPLLFALAKELEDLGEHRRSFAALVRGCSLRRGMMHYDVGGDIEAIDSIRTRFDARSLQGCEGRGAHLAGACPIFVVGLPRSGTTLVERVLNSHSEVAGLGELQAFPSAAVEGVQALAGRNVDKVAFAEVALQVDPRWLGQRYLVEANRTGTRYFVDKLPINYLYIGLIRRALPDAKIVLVERNPMDVCYAMYKTLFGDAYPFSYDLVELARYYAAFRRLMDHWGDMLGPSLHRLSYDRLVRDPVPELHRLLAYLELPWEDDCLAFHRGTGPVATASATQVRQPLHTRSLGAWRKYTEELRPLADHLHAEHIPT